MIAATNIYVHFGERVLLDNVSVVIGTRDRVGLVGRNGAGKSTMLKIISGQMNPDGGQISRPNGSTLGYLHQDMSLPKGKTVLNETLSALEEIRMLEKKIALLDREIAERTDYETQSYLDLLHDHSELSEHFHLLGGHQLNAEAERVLKGLGFKTTDMNRLTDEFSGGWQMRVELAKMLLCKPDYLLLDEPTNHLDIESIIWLENFLQDYPGAIIVISHDKQFLDNITTRTVEIELGNIYEYKASYSKYVEMRKERREMQQSAYENQQKVIAQKEKTINRFMAKATKTSMAQSMQKQLDKMDRIEIDSEDVAVMNIRFPDAPRSGQIVVDAHNVTKSYGRLHVLDHISLKLDRGDRVAFVGQNGQGKTTLAKILVNAETHNSGTVTLGHNVQIGYYAQNQAENLSSNLTLLETLEEISPPEMRTRLRAILGAFMFSGDDANKKVSVLSGGERARLALACLLLRPFNLLVLDEPTNHLDMLSKEVLKRALMDYNGALIVVSHDRDFLAGLANRTIEFRDRRLHEYLGDINFFLEKRSLDDMRLVEISTVNKNVAPVQPEKVLSYEEKKEQEKTKKKLQRAVQQAESDILRLEQELKTLEQTMSAEGYYESPQAGVVLDKYKHTKKKLEEVIETWEQAQIELEEFENA